MNSRLAAALRAFRDGPAELSTASPEPQRENGGDPLDEAIATLRETPIAEIQARGFHFQSRDYYSPLNDLEFLEQNRDLWQRRAMPRGIEWDLDAQFAFVRRLAPAILELADVPQEMPPGPPSYHWRNDFWTGGDALIHYGLLREAKPRRVVEVGCGWSSLLMARALARNEDEGAPPATVDQVEPYARTELLRALPEDWRLHETMLQRAPLELFEQLGDGDICFYDGSHVARAGSDVNWFFFVVVPRLAPGVIVHVHDIFWPFDYPETWIFDRGQTWNEQYVLQAFLMLNREFEVIVSNCAIFDAYEGEMEDLFGTFPVVRSGCSLWMRRKPAAGRDEDRGGGIGVAAG